ncbi:MAG TPA: hypothetical protein VFI11_01205 [Anaerolineales bacterium]|nr:hypothetical protein [Anaerolineales bacterium]
MAVVPVTDEYRLLVHFERIRIPGLVDTMSSQAPEIVRAVDVLAEKSLKSAQEMGKEGWRLVSHSVDFTAGMAVMTLTLARPQV